MKKILPYIAIICFASLTALSFGQIINPTQPTTAGTGLNRTGTALNVLYGTTAGTAKQGNAVSTVAQGGTGVATLAAHGVLVGNAASALNVTGAGSSGQCFISNGAGADPTFQACSAGGGVTSVFSLTGVVGNLTGDVTTSNSTVTTLKNTGTAGTYGQVTTDAQGRVSAGTTIGDVAHGGTGVATLFAHGVLMGNGASTVVVSNAGTTGQCFTSNGASADPTFQACGAISTVTVPNGGTGVATLTNHGVVIGQGAANVVVTSAGTATQVLTSNGASADPTFQSISSGGLTFISSTTVGTQATIDLLSSFSATYDNYKLFCNGLKVAVQDQIGIRVANAGITDAASDYVAIPVGTATSTTLTAITGGNILATAGIGANLELTYTNANSASNIKAINGQMVANSDSAPTRYSSSIFTAAYIGAAMSGTRLYLVGANNFTGGVCKLYGYQN